MTTELLGEDDDLQLEIERRLRELRASPEEFLRRFDRNGDGILDPEELRAARAVVQRQLEDDAEQEILAGRYRIVAAIGRGAQGHTRLAVDEQTGEFVAVKELDFAGVGSWDAVAMFERESAVLGGLNHPAIPGVRDNFRIEQDEVLRLFLVQEFIDGDNLQVRLADQRLFDGPTLRRYAEELLDILVYLHGHSPPVLHRDIKPANIIERADGSLALVDFGAAQGDGRQATVIGTSGYMPADQLMGRATPSSDLYALGATLVHLATTTHPTELQTDGLRLDWKRYANLPAGFERWVDRLIEPFPDDRFPTAVSARAALRRETIEQPLQLETLEELTDSIAGPEPMLEVTDGKPTGCPIHVRRNSSRIDVDLSENRSRIPAWMALQFLVLGAIAVYAGEWLIATMFGVPIIIGLFVFGFRKQVVHLSGTPSSIRLRMDGDDVVKGYPLAEVAGPEVVSGKSTEVVRLVLRSGEKFNLITLRDRKHAMWLSNTLRTWLIERRMNSGD